MSRVDYELLDKLTVWMREGGFTRLTYTRGKATVTLHLPESANPRPRPALRTIHSPTVGAFHAGHPLADKPYVEIGSEVDAGAIVALLGIGPVLLPVEAPCAGIIRSVLQEEGRVVGFDDLLFEIEPTGGSNAD